MSEDSKIVSRFRSLSVWEKGGQRAPHKPLLCLLAISQMVNEKRRLLNFKAIENTLSGLLTEFGPPRKVCHPEYPFWCLQNEDEIWEVRSVVPISARPGSVPTRATLLRSDAEGGFRANIFESLATDGERRSQVIADLLNSHFPETIHDDILQSLSLTTSGERLKRKERDSQFRDKILSAYEYRCAVCGFNVRIGHIVIALEAAHIKWHQAGGPDVHENGLALCSLHHKLFDRGAFSLDPGHQVLVSERAYGTGGFDEHLGRYHRKPLIKPVRDSYSPKSDYLNWHMRQVFLAPERE